MKKIFLFYGFSFFISCAAWVSAAIMGIEANAPAGVVLTAIGGISPTLAVLIMLGFFSKKVEKKQYLNSLRFSRIPAKWYPVIILLPFTIVILSKLIEKLIYNASLWPMLTDELHSNPLSLLPYAVFILFFGPLPEELGWRGYALDRLVRNLGPIGGGLINAVAWAAWHIPLFFIVGYPLKEMNMSGWEMAVFFGTFIPNTFLYVWVYYKTNRSTIAAILFHFSINYNGMIFIETPYTGLIKGLVTTVVAIVVIYFERELFFDFKKYSEKNIKIEEVEII